MRNSSLTAQGINSNRFDQLLENLLANLLAYMKTLT